MPQITQPLLPGVRGKDYRFVRHGDRVYVVYQVRLPNGKVLRLAWRVDPEDYRALGIERDRIPTISRAQFQRLEFFGSASDIAGGDPNEHPLQKYLRSLREQFGNVSWLSDREVVAVMLMGYAEGWSAEQIRQRITRTRWYQQRTSYQRTWELEMTRADRRAAVGTWVQRMTAALEELYGPGYTLAEAGIDRAALRKQAEMIASGKWGDPSEGFELWLAQERKKAEGIEGTAAWIERQQQIEEQRAFMNRPEDVFEQLRQDAIVWLGPRAVPSTEVLRNWSERLVSGLASEADWQQWIQNQARALYPWLGPNETWQDRASAYKRIVEETWGQPIGWDHEILTRIGQTDEAGRPTGAAMPYDDFARLIRQREEFWQGPVAREEGFQLFNYLQSVFTGVGG